jgi:hypothetical protein
VTSHPVIFPQDFDEHESEIESKGWLSGVRLHFEGRDHVLTFYDPARLGQEIEDEINRGSIFFAPNLIVVKSVTRHNMEAAINVLIKSGGVRSLIAG